MEFLLADAVQQGCGAVITCGGVQSNHCRATAIAARELGLDPYLVLRTPPEVLVRNFTVEDESLFLKRFCAVMSF